MRTSQVNNFLFAVCLILQQVLQINCLLLDTYDFRSVTSNDGLPHGHITAVHPSQNRFMWIGTIATGLARFDGRNFEVFGIQNGLTDDMITCDYEDSDENLWFAAYKVGAPVYATIPLDISSNRLFLTLRISLELNRLTIDTENRIT